MSSKEIPYFILLALVKMPSTFANNWENHVKDHPSNNLSNKMVVSFFSCFSTKKSLDDCLFSAIEEKHTNLMAQAPITSYIMFLHHFTKVGGTRTMPTTRIFALIGTDEVAFPAQINKEVLFESTTTKYSVCNQFTTLTDPEGVVGINVRENAI